MRLTTRRLILREPKIKDVKSLVEGINNINISKWLLEVPYPYTAKDARLWISKSLKNSKKKERNGFGFYIQVKGKPGVIGNVGLGKIDRFQGTATIGYWLRQEYWRQGIMQEAVTRVIDYAFKDLKLRRINISAFVGNEGSNGLIRKLGFTYEGTRKKACKSKSNGKIHDEHIYGLLKENWKHQ